MGLTEEPWGFLIEGAGGKNHGGDDVACCTANQALVCTGNSAAAAGDMVRHKGEKLISLETQVLA